MLNSLRLKIFLLFTLGIFLVGLIVILIFTFEIQHRYKELFIEKGNNSALKLAFKTKKLFDLGLLSKEFVGYEKLCQEILAQNKEISYVALLDNKNRVVFYAGDSNLNINQEFLIYKVLKDSLNIKSSILVVINKDLINEKTYEFLKSIFIYSTFTIIFIIIFILIYLKINLGEPLNLLVKHIKDMDLTKVSNSKWSLLNRKDEIGTVANAFEELINKLIISQNSLSHSNKELVSLNKELDKKVDEELRKNREKDLQLIEQSKMAALGEMISNIAHQWRQPLSEISTCATGLKLQKEFGKFSDEDFYNGMDIINNKTQYLSKTIETFRNFLIEKKEFKELSLQEEIDKLLLIVNETLNINFITLHNEIDYSNNIKVKLISEEFCQAMINIINNSKDVLIERKIENPYITLSLKVNKNRVTLVVEDNGGGIPNELLSRIFEPYFTTKHKSVGTGLGLHISYRIITESLKGEIQVENSNLGAKFLITLPLVV